MKIFLLHYYSSTANPAYGQIAQAMRQQDHSVVVASRDRHDNIVFNDGNTCETVISKPSKYQESQLFSSLINKILFLGFILRIRRAIRHSAPDVVQLNKAKISWYWLIPIFMPKKIKFIQDCRQVSSKNHASSFIKRLKRQLNYIIHTLAIRFIFHKASYLHQRGALYELGPDWHKNSFVVPLGVGHPFSNCPYSPPKYQKHFSFLYIGSITKIRKLDMLIEAAALQKKESGANFKLVFAGPDNTDGYYKNRVKELNAEDTVEFLGPINYEDIPSLICNHHVALAYVPYIPQDWAYQPTLKILEYLAIGIPVLATDVSPNIDVLEQANNGITVKNSARDWQKGMHRYITDTNFYHKTLQQAQSNRSGDSWDDVAAMYINEYTVLFH